MIYTALAIASLAVLACRPTVRAGAPCATAPMFAPFDERHAAPREPASDGILDAIVAWYQHAGRSRELPGGGCQFAPTCSAYARAALRRYGPVAVILIVDRLLVREHLTAGAYYPAVCVGHTTRLADGVP